MKFENIFQKKHVNELAVGDLEIPSQGVEDLELYIEKNTLFGFILKIFSKSWR